MSTPYPAYNLASVGDLSFDLNKNTFYDSANGSIPVTNYLAIGGALLTGAYVAVKQCDKIHNAATGKSLAQSKADHNVSTLPGMSWMGA